MKVNIKKLSEITGFSQATVSNALNNKRRVNKETAETILAAAKVYGYNNENRIKSIRLVLFKNSGNVLSDTPFFSAVIEGVEMESRNAGYETTVTNLHKSDPNYDTLLSQVVNDPGSAIILLATEMMPEDVQAFQNTVNPIVVLDNWFEEHLFDSVLMANTDSVYDAVKYLIDKGHKEIGYLRGDMRIKNFYYREKGYERALHDAGLERKPEYAFTIKTTMDGAYEDMAKRLEEKPVLPTAFFADNDIIALGAMKALKEYGYQIPHDVSVIGFDDLPYGTISSPALTTIRVFKQEMGQTAVRRLTEIMKENSEAKLKIQVCNAFIERESVRDLTR